MDTTYPFSIGVSSPPTAVRTTVVLALALTVAYGAIALAVMALITGDAILLAGLVGATAVLAAGRARDRLSRRFDRHDGLAALSRDVSRRRRNGRDA